MLRLRRRKDGVVVVDLMGRRPGRSAWVCATRSCVDAGVRRRGIVRALRGPAGHAVLDPQTPELWGALVAAADGVVDLLRKTAGHTPAARLSAFTALQQQLRVEEVS
jgi:hypothetical protein